MVAAGNCIDHSRCYGQVSCQALRPNNQSLSAQEAYESSLYSSAAALYQPGTHTVTMRLEAQPETEADWDQFFPDMVPPGNEGSQYYVYSAFKIDLGGCRMAAPHCGSPELQQRGGRSCLVQEACIAQSQWTAAATAAASTCLALHICCARWLASVGWCWQLLAAMWLPRQSCRCFSRAMHTGSPARHRTA